MTCARARLAITTTVAVVLSVLVGAGPATAESVTADQLTGLLTVQADDVAHAYDRDFFNHWIDEDGDGCNTRYEVLIEESTTPVTLGSGCSLSGGTWVSPYDDAVWSDPSDVDIDHMVPLAEAWRSGAWSWTPAQREDFANDLAVPYALVAVTDNVNQSKGDQDPAEWLPPQTSYRCEYVIDWALVKYRWSLTVDAAEETALASVLAGSCGSTTVVLPAVAVTTTAPDPGTISGFPDGITRLAGANRYETAVKISQKYDPGVPVVYVATGANFPDALSAAAAAAYLGGPLLLTQPTSLPSVVKSEIQRLAPTRIVVIGGTLSVSSGVAAELSALAPVTRYGGANRYETGLMIVDATFGSAPAAIVATGRAFPDALAATGVAGALNAPVILVDGTRSTVSATTLATLERLGVTSVLVVGGTLSVSSGIHSQLQNAGYAVSRYGGANRYETAALINDAYFGSGSTDTMFLATGENFPDALAGAALAGRLKAPVYISRSACAPTPIHDSVAALAPAKKVVLGGTLSLSDIAAMNWECPPGTLYPGTVTAGAFCASTNSGWYGYTSAGTLMQCRTSPTDTRLRWRAV